MYRHKNNYVERIVNERLFIITAKAFKVNIYKSKKTNNAAAGKGRVIFQTTKTFRR